MTMALLLAMIFKKKMKGLGQEVQPKDNQIGFQEVNLILWKSLQVVKDKMTKSSKIILN